MSPAHSLYLLEPTDSAKFGKASLHLKNAFELSVCVCVCVCVCEMQNNAFFFLPQLAEQVRLAVLHNRAGKWTPGAMYSMLTSCPLGF